MLSAMTRADAIVVLGCRITASGRPAPPAARRAATAARAFLAGAAPWVVASGGRRWGSQIEAKALGRAMVGAGVPPGAVIEEHWSLSTYENAIFSAAILARLGAKNTILVTCPWHLPRALADFRAAGVDAVPLPAGEGDLGLSRSRRLYLAAHERVCTFLDARAMRRADVLAESAARIVAAGRSPASPEAVRLEVDA